MELHERADGLVVINDAYNANPASMAAALDALAAIGERRSAAPLRCSARCSSWARRTTRRTTRSAGYAARSGIDVVVAVGDPAAGIAAGASGTAAGAEPR